MKTNFAFFILIACALFSGCANVQSNKSNISIEKESSGFVRFEKVIVHSEDSTVTVSGSIHSQPRNAAIGHVDITFLSPDGDVLHVLKTQIHRQSIKDRHLHFRVKTSLVLPECSTVRIVHHKSSHNGNG